MRIVFRDLEIRNAERADCAQLCRWWNDGAVMAHAGFPNGLGTTEEKIAAQIATDSDDTRRRLVIAYQGRLIGECSYRVLPPEEAEIGIKICEKDMQEKGLGKQLLSMLIGALFDRGMTRIVLDTNLANTRAQHVYERLGFRRLGVRENSWQDQLDRWQSAVDYALTPDEFVDFTKE